MVLKSAAGAAFLVFIAVAGVVGQQEVDMEGMMPLATSRQHANGDQGQALNQGEQNFHGHGLAIQQSGAR